MRLVWARGGNRATSEDLQVSRGFGARIRVSGLLQRTRHDKAAAFLEVFGVFRVVGIGGPPDLEVAFDVEAGRAKEREYAIFARLRPATEH